MIFRVSNEIRKKRYEFVGDLVTTTHRLEARLAMAGSFSRCSWNRNSLSNVLIEISYRILEFVKRTRTILTRTGLSITDRFCPFRAAI